MTNNTGANLFTIKFSSSSEYEEEDQKSDPPLSPPPKNRSPIRMAPTRVYKQTINNTPIELELSDSSYYSENEYSNKDHGFIKTDKSPQLNDDNSFIDSGIELTPTNVKKHTERYGGAEIEHASIDKEDKSAIQWNPRNQAHQSRIEKKLKPDEPIDTSNSNFSISDDTQSNHNEDLVPKSNDQVRETPQSITQPPKIDQNTASQIRPTKFNSQSWPIYLIARKKVMHLGGRRIQFTMSCSQQILYTALPSSKGNSPKRVFINHYPSQKSDTADALLSITRGPTDNFSLTKSTDSNTEILTIQISPPKTTADTARKLTVNFLQMKEGTPARLMSKNPKLNPDGKPEHDFQGRFAIESVKNAVLIDRLNGPNMLYVRKAGKNEIEMEARFEHDTLWLFAIGIASFLSHIK